MNEKKEISIKDVKPFYPAILFSFGELANMIQTTYLKIEEGIDELYNTYPYAGDFFIYDKKLYVPAGDNTLCLIKDKDDEKIMNLISKKNEKLLFSYKMADEFFNISKRKINIYKPINGIGQIRKKKDESSNETHYTVRMEIGSRPVAVDLGSHERVAQWTYNVLQEYRSRGIRIRDVIIDL